MALQFIVQYVVAVAGLLAGGAAGFLVALGVGRASPWDTRTTLPLVLAAGTAHLALVPVVEEQRQVLFGLYFLATAAVYASALLRLPAWRAGAVVFPAGSIGAYFYFASLVHQVDVVGLAVKVVELAAIGAALAGAAVAARGGATRGRRSLA